MTLLRHLLRVLCGNLAGVILAILAAEVLKGGAALMNTSGTVPLMAGAVVTAIAVLLGIGSIVATVYPVFGLVAWARKEIK